VNVKNARGRNPNCCRGIDLHELGWFFVKEGWERLGVHRHAFACERLVRQLKFIFSNSNKIDVSKLKLISNW
jgi:hypothetical protein